MTKIEVDIRPFTDLLLGSFSITTGTSIDMHLLNISEHVTLGFGQMGEVFANFLSNPLALSNKDGVGWSYVACYLDTTRVKTGRKLGFPVLYVCPW